jgi:hypothetical protein
MVMVWFPHLIWFEQARDALNLAALSGGVEPNRTAAFIRIGGALLLAQTGLLLLTALAGSPGGVRRDAPTIDRPGMDPFARLFVYYFALASAWAALLFQTVLGRAGLAAGTAPLLIFSGLAVVVAAGDSIRIYRQRGAALLWLGLLVLPPLGAVAAVTLLPWVFPLDFKVMLPARDMGQFFAENFQRRTGRPLAIVAGEPHLAELIALTAPSRPSLLLQATPERTRWVTPQSIAENGMVVVWTALDTTGAAPAEIRAAFPELVPELPHRFLRRVEGRLPPLRVGWAVIRPRSITTPPATPAE